MGDIVSHTLPGLGESVVSRLFRVAPVGVDRKKQPVDSMRHLDSAERGSNYDPGNKKSPWNAIAPIWMVDFFRLGFNGL